MGKPLGRTRPKAWGAAQLNSNAAVLGSNRAHPIASYQFMGGLQPAWYSTVSCVGLGGAAEVKKFEKSQPTGGGGVPGEDE